LVQNHTTSCGCIQSKGEEKIADWLKLHGIKFERQKTFDSCRNDKTNYLLRFDFFIEDKVLIEYDGINHFKATNGWNFQENVNETQYRDSIKNNWAKKNNIPLIRISYNECYNDEKLQETLLNIIIKYKINHE
jgi:very-short-patch-repair endonuclease